MSGDLIAGRVSSPVTDAMCLPLAQGIADRGRHSG